MKKNGFVIIETIIVMTIVMISLIGMYNTYFTIIKNLTQRKYYDNINDIYRLNIMMKLYDSSIYSTSGFYVYDSASCTKIDCNNIINSLIENGTDIKFIVINNYDLDNMENSEYNTLKRYLNTTEYNYKKIAVLTYKENNNEHFVNLEV